MEYHLKVWYDIINELGGKLTLGEVRGHMYGKNNEVLTRVFGAERFSLQEMEVLSRKKEEQYQAMFRPHLALVPGLAEFLRSAQEKDIAMAIGSAANLFNIDFVLDGLNIRPHFKAIVSADDVSMSKPHPDTFLKAAKALNVEPTESIVFEDAPKGVEAAYNAGMQCVVITTMHREEEFEKYPNVLFFIKDYKDPKVLELLN